MILSRQGPGLMSLRMPLLTQSSFGPIITEGVKSRAN